LTRGKKTVAGARIRRAAAADAAALTALARTSKAVWGYDAAFMAACRNELTVGAGDVLGDPTFVIEAEGRILGFYQLRHHGAAADVALFFVAPEAMRTGIGRRLWVHLERTARASGAERLEVDSDPHAEGFYRAMGMRRIGQALSGSIAGRMLPHLVKDLAPAATGHGTAAREDAPRSDGPPVPR
jgi:GNAT superfamily N-acetyltransferase